MKKMAYIVLLLLLPAGGWAQHGCTDPLARNYAAGATVNDGSCTYAATSLPLTNRKDLPGTLNNNSGLVYTDGNLWTINDSGNAASIYRIDEASGAILQTVRISGVSNRDWEAITADENYIYIGDFGNNASGTRSNLRVYRINKDDIKTEMDTTVPAEAIHFTYEDQEITVSPGNENTDFDCEAFVVLNGNLHLFTKQWVNSRITRHYMFPATPGVHIARYVEEMEVDGLITDASLSASHGNALVLIGYSANLINTFMWLFFDYSEDQFFSGNKRRFSLGTTLQNGQIEGVTFSRNGNGYISSERISGLFSVPPRLQSFSLTNFVPETGSSRAVEFSDFTAAFEAPHVQLNWKTSLEENSAIFQVQRSADGKAFEKVGEVQAKGVAGAYDFTDVFPKYGKSFYRIKQTDQKENFSYSAIVEVTTAPFALQASPVPAGYGQLLTLSLPKGQSGKALLVLSGPKGKTYLRMEISLDSNLDEELNLDSLPRGLYFVRVTSAKETYSTKILLL